MANEQPAPPANAEEAPKSGGIMGKMIIGAFMGVVILTECMLAYMWIPDPNDVAAEVEAKMIKTIESLNQSPQESGVYPHDKYLEFELGDYTITSHNAGTDSSLRVDFKLVGTVLEEDKPRLEELFQQHQHRFRDQVLFEIRNSDYSDLRDPGLGLIKRKILEKSNKLFGEPILKSVIFSNYSHVEQ